jgi:hypothetical protein
LPDFLITINNGNKILVEINSSEHSTNNKVWINYFREAKLKYPIFHKYCKDNNLIPMWLTEDMFNTISLDNYT